MDPCANQQHADKDEEAAKDLREGPVIGHVVGQGQVLVFFYHVTQIEEGRYLENFTEVFH